MSVALALAFWLVATVAMGLANTAGFHRLLTHRSYDTSRGIRYLLTLLSAMHSGSPIQWVGLHRKHHSFSDTDLDAHSTLKGFWFAHCGWLFFGIRHPLPCMFLAVSGFGLQILFLIYDIQRLLGRLKPSWRGTARDLMKERFMVLLDTPLVIPALFALQLWAAWSIGQWWGILWLWALHVVQNNASWVVNSFCHLPSVGSHVEGVGDLSRDVPWLGWLTNGDSFHSHHHQYPSSACHALEGGMDMSWVFICALHRLGLASNVKLPPGVTLPAWASRDGWQVEGKVSR